MTVRAARWVLVAGTAAASGALAVGCNALLGNDPWTLATADASADSPGPQPDGGQDARPSPDTGADAVASDAVADGAPDCPGNGTRCNGTCTDTTGDARNCGACNHDCTALSHVTGTGATCSASKCVVPASACAPGYLHCTANPDDGCETDITKATQCGACGAACPAATPSCQSNGTGGYGCVSGCSGATPTLCGTSCVNTTTDPNHCSSCTLVCSSPATGGIATCVGSQCGVQCNGGYHQCGTSATCARDDDATKCGASCVFCSAPASNGSATCSGGACGVACNVGAHQCGTTAVCALDNDATKCGASCTSCPAPANADPTCTNNQCGYACKLGYSKCGSSCFDLLTDSSNCGACGHSCQGDACQGGYCVRSSITASGAGALVSDAANIYWVNSAGVFSCPGAGCSGAPTTIHSGGAPTYLWSNGNQVVWNESGMGTTNVCPVAGCPGNTPTRLYTAGAALAPYYIVATSSTAFWVEQDISSGVTTIRSCALSGCGGAAGTAVGIAGPNYVLTTDGTNLIWDDSGSLYTCVASNCVNTSVRITSSAGNVASIAIRNSIVYWADGSGNVRSCPVASNCTPATLATATGQAADGFVADSTSVYWVFKGTAAGGYNDSKVLSCPLGGCTGTARVVQTNQATANHLAGVGSFLYWTAGGTIWRASK